MKKQILIIRGGDSFKTRREYLSFLKNWRIDIERYTSRRGDWKRTLGEALGKKFEVIIPEMPNRMNAQYAEWKLWFEKFVPYLRPGVVLIGHSLGGIFLAKYLSETRFPKKIRGTFLVAPPYGEGSFSTPKNFRKLQEQGGKIFLYHSKDDPVVPFSDFEKYRTSLKTAVARVFTNRGHFNKEKFPELVQDIGDLYE